MRLSDYQLDTQALLHDQNGLFTPIFQLNRYINQARDRVAADSGCLRNVVAGTAPFGAGAQAGTAVPGGAVAGTQPTSGFWTIAGQEKYPFAYANQYAIAANAGVRSVIDVQNIAVSWGGAMRPVQNWLPWDQLQAYGRSYNVGVFSFPMVWSTSGVGVTNQVWLWPAPSTTQEMEWDCTFLPKALHSNDDYDAIPSPFDQAVKFWAAKLAKLAALRFAEAEAMEAEYWKELGSGNSVSDRGHIADYYADWTQW